jgi:hypothetical protein
MDEQINNIVTAISTRRNIEISILEVYLVAHLLIFDKIVNREASP